MRLLKAFSLAFILAVPGLVSPLSAQNAPQCPMSGSPSDWGFNSTGYIMIASKRKLLIFGQYCGRNLAFEHFAKAGPRDVAKAQ
jgi:hypothetical protein